MRGGGLKGSAQRLGQQANVGEFVERGHECRSGFCPELECEIRRLSDKGHTLREVSRMLGCSKHAVSNAMVREPKPPGGHRLEPLAGEAVAERTRTDPCGP